jgi:nitrite reductase (NADH) small subunit
MNYCVGSIDEIPKGKALIVDVKGISVGIFYEKGRVHAIRNVCPHKQAPICKGTICGTMLPSEPSHFEFGLEGKVLKCPWHGWEFDLDSGKSLFGISNRKVKTYPVEVKNGSIYVEMN